MCRGPAATYALSAHHILRSIHRLRQRCCSNQVASIYTTANGALLCSSCLLGGHLNSLWWLQVGLQAYLMWEQAGKPDGANFSDDARRQLEQQVQSGKSVQDIEHALKGSSDQKAPEGHQPDHKVHTPQRTCDVQQWMRESDNSLRNLTVSLNDADCICSAHTELDQSVSQPQCPLLCDHSA